MQLLTFVFFAFVLCILPSTTTGQQNTPATQIWTLPIVGPPTTNVSIQGIGFDPVTPIDVYFDTTVLASTTTDTSGQFGRGVIKAGGPTWTRLQIPPDALPGQHTITAKERVGQKSAQKTFLVRTDWLQFQFEPDRTGLNPYENILSPGTVGNMDVAWHYAAGSGFGTSSAVAYGVVYFGNSLGGTLYALDANTGALIWQYALGFNIFVDDSPAVANGVVYFSASENIYALNANTGVLIWKYATGTYIWSSPAVVDGVVYIASQDQNLYALDASTGALIWKYATGAQVYSSPAVANGMVYIVSDKLYALDANTGDLVWTHSGGGVSSPAVVNGVVYVGLPFAFTALDARTGALIWNYSLGEDESPTTPAVANGVVYFGTNENIYALDASTGALLWKYPTGYRVVNAPAVANGVVYVGAVDKGLYTLDASTGALLWGWLASLGEVDSSPTVANGMVYVGGGDGNLYAFALPNQQKSGKFSPPQRPDPALLVPDWSPLQPNTAAPPTKK